MGVLKDKAAQDMARKRAESLTPARRQEIAKGAAKARWGRAKPMLAAEPSLAGAVDKPTLPLGVRCSKHKVVNCGRCGG